MKIRSLKRAILVMALVFVSGLALIPAKSVSADTDVEIQPGQTIDIDYQSDKVWWIKYVAKTEKMVEISSTGKNKSVLSLYKGSKNDASLVTTSDYLRPITNNSNNFQLAGILPAGTYYFRVTGSYSYSVKTEVSLKDITDTTLVAAINSSNFRDANFRAYVDENFNIRKDNKITKDEMMIVRSINVDGQSISNMKGTEYFTEITELSCNNNQIKTLNLSKNTKLKYVECERNNLTTLILSGCPELYDLDCSRNPDLTSLDLSKNKKLSNLSCYSCGIETLDLTGQPNLNYLFCSNNPLSSMIIKEDVPLYTLNCSNTALTSLDVSSFSRLGSLSCNGCSKLKSLKLSSSINTLNCYNCNLSSLSIGSCCYLTTLSCYGNKIRTLDISGSIYLVYVYETAKKSAEYYDYYRADISGYDCYLAVDKENITIKTMSGINDKVVKLESKNFPDINFLNKLKESDLDGDGWLSKGEIATITQLSLSYSGVVKLDGIKYLTGICSLYVDGNSLSELDLSGNTNLEYLSATYNKLTKVNLSKNTKLKNIYIGMNQLASLDLTHNTELIYLQCPNNYLTSLDLSKNTKLERLYCYGNLITSLDLGKNTKLITVDCCFNQISKLNIGNCRELEQLDCSSNEISELNITNCPLLLKVYKEGKKTGDGCVMHSYTGNRDNSSEFLIYDLNTKIITTVSIKLDKKTANVVCGNTATLKATLDCEGTASWKSSDTKIATVDSKGKITGKQAGKVTITATAFGKSATCTVTVLYKDVTNSSDFWYAPTNYLTAAGVVRGYANQTEFRPANNCTRAQMVTFLYRLQGEPKTKSNTCKFKDVKEKDYYFKPVIWATEKGITTGTSGTTFSPSKVCTRAQTVTFLWRMANKPEPKTKTNPFKDVDQKAYYYKATLWASEKKILVGYDDQTFRPQNKCLRRQMVTFLYKYDKYVNGKG